MSTIAVAAQPERPGAFGRDRALGVHTFQQGGAPGASDWGKIAAQRGSTNGAMNREYKQLHGGAPTRGVRSANQNDWLKIKKPGSSLGLYMQLPSDEKQVEWVFIKLRFALRNGATFR